MDKILLLNGPNLNLLGQRENDIYGADSLASIEDEVSEWLSKQGYELECHQSNHEGELIDWIHKANEKFSGVLLNPGAYTHTSIALRDAIEAIKTPVVEVHISNIHARESFRHHSLIAPVAAGQIVGFGKDSYVIGAYSLLKRLTRRGVDNGETT